MECSVVDFASSTNAAAGRMQTIRRAIGILVSGRHKRCVKKWKKRNRHDKDVFSMPMQEN